MSCDVGHGDHHHGHAVGIIQRRSGSSIVLSRRCGDNGDDADSNAVTAARIVQSTRMPDWVLLPYDGTGEDVVAFVVAV